MQRINDDMYFIYLPKKYCKDRKYDKGDVFAVLNNNNKNTIILRKLDDEGFDK